MPNVDVLRAELPPIEAVTITLTQEEAEELAGILGRGFSLVNGLYWDLQEAGLAGQETDAYRRGYNAHMVGPEF